MLETPKWTSEPPLQSWTSEPPLQSENSWLPELNRKVHVSTMEVAPFCSPVCQLLALALLNMWHCQWLPHSICFERLVLKISFLNFLLEIIS
jgi:hypothetical protein